jgi:hypothetical protein
MTGLVKLNPSGTFNSGGPFEMCNVRPDPRGFDPGGLCH